MFKYLIYIYIFVKAFCLQFWLYEMETMLQEDTIIPYKNIAVAEPKIDTSGRHCALIPMKGLQLGSTQVLVEYEYGTVHLRATATIAAYKPLKV